VALQHSALTGQQDAPDAARDRQLLEAGAGGEGGVSLGAAGDGCGGNDDVSGGDCGVYAHHAWNLNVLPRNPSSVMRFAKAPDLATAAPGLVVPSLSVGSCLAAACWRQEPLGLYSITYLHVGGNVPEYRGISIFLSGVYTYTYIYVYICKCIYVYQVCRYIHLGSALLQLHVHVSVVLKGMPTSRTHTAALRLWATPAGPDMEFTCGISYRTA
jgi:hypothetical protein